MRDITVNILHCADTRTDQSFSISDVRKWHLARGWSDVGYHYYIRLNGVLEKGRDLDRVGSHAYGFNKGSIGTCFEGGKNPDGSKWSEPTAKQIETFVILNKYLNEKLDTVLDVRGHYEFSKKTCPNFDICVLEDYLK